MAVALTSMMMLVLGPGEDTNAQNTQTDTVTAIVAETDSALVMEAATDSAEEEEVKPSAREATNEAVGNLKGIWNGFYGMLPKIALAIGILMIAWLIVRLLRWVLPKFLGHWQKASAMSAMVGIAVWLLALGIAVSVVAGDIRALVGSLGLVGLALSWSLQTPIESFTGWLLNSFQGYYRVGDRISVGDVFGDVFRIDFLTTTVWEIGAPYRSGYVRAEQPTGRLVTFPNSEVLSGTVVNLTRDFDYLWDELSLQLANESDLRLAMQVLEQVSLELIGNYMIEPAHQYEKLLQQARLESFISDKPQVFISASESWTDLTVRYLVGARERRKWKSELLLRITEEFNKEEYIGKIISAYPRQQVQFIRPDGVPADLADLGG